MLLALFLVVGCQCKPDIKVVTKLVTCKDKVIESCSGPMTPEYAKFSSEDSDEEFHVKLTMNITMAEQYIKKLKLYNDCVFKILSLNEDSKNEQNSSK